MRVLVTGHNGYIGSIMVPLLQDAGHEVVGFDTRYYGDCDFGEFGDQVEAIRKDIRDVEASDLAGFDADTFRGLARLRGVECASPTRFAEAFHSAKSVLDLRATPARDSRS